MSSTAIGGGSPLLRLLSRARLLRAAHPGINRKRVYRLYFAADLAVRKRAKGNRPVEGLRAAGGGLLADIGVGPDARSDASNLLRGMLWLLD